MSTKWTKTEEAALFEAMGGKSVMLSPKAKEIARTLSGRTPEAIRRHWLLIRWNRKPETPLLGYNPLLDPKASTVDIMRALRAKESLLDMDEIVSVLRTAGLRGRVTIELGE